MRPFLLFRSTGKRSQVRYSKRAMGYLKLGIINAVHWELCSSLLNSAIFMWIDTISVIFLCVHTSIHSKKKKNWKTKTLDVDVTYFNFLALQYENGGCMNSWSGSTLRALNSGSKILCNDGHFKNTVDFLLRHFWYSERPTWRCCKLLFILLFNGSNKYSFEINAWNFFVKKDHTHVYKLHINYLSLQLQVWQR
jgi:hypothetical protein